jgi:polyphosphate kinase
MPRNLDRRVELLFPIEDERIKSRIFTELAVMFRDTEKCKIKCKNGLYKSVDKTDMEVMNSQDYFQLEAKQAEIKFADTIEPEMFIPALPEHKSNPISDQY